tara:strand:+ start:1525 stop:2031 length:507 start_codon:yes stop_codon:yes gene_type:complete
MDQLTTNTRTVSLDLETDFLVFVKFLSNKKLSTYFEAVTLREHILMFGLDPTSNVATLASSVISEIIQTTAHGTISWQLLQSGWGEIVDDTQMGMGATFVRNRRIVTLMLKSLLPLYDYTIDILNSETLKHLRYATELTDKELELKHLILVLFDKETYPRQHLRLDLM